MIFYETVKYKRVRRN